MAATPTWIPLVQRKNEPMIARAVQREGLAASQDVARNDPGVAVLVTV